MFALNLTDKNIFLFILSLTSHWNFCKICSFLFEEKKQNSQNFKNGFLNKMQFFKFSLPHLTGRDREIKRQRCKICPLWSLPPGFSIKQPDVEDVTTVVPQKGNILSARKLFFPHCLLRFFFHLDLGDSKKVMVFTEINEPKFTKTQGAERN